MRAKVGLLKDVVFVRKGKKSCKGKRLEDGTGAASFPFTTFAEGSDGIYQGAISFSLIRLRTGQDQDSPLRHRRRLRERKKLRAKGE